MFELIYLVAASLFALAGLAVVFAYATASLFAQRRLAAPDDLPRADRLREALGSLSREATSSFGLVLALPFGLAGLRHGSGDPLLLVPGHGQRSAALWPLRAWLPRQGLPWPALWSPPLLTPAPAAAPELGEAIRRLSRLHGDRPVDVVAYGAGALTLAHAAAEPLPLGRVVTVCAPWRGAPIALWLPAGEALLPRSGELVAPTEGLAGAAWTDLASSDDPMIPPPFDAPPAGAERATIPLAGHNHALHSPRVWRAIRAALLPGEEAER